MKNGPGDPRWGWQMLMEDLKSSKVPLQPQPEQPMQQVQQPPQQQGAPITNIVNYPPMQVPMILKRFNFASVFAIVVMVIFLTILGVVLWRTGALQHIYDVFRSLLI